MKWSQRKAIVLILSGASLVEVAKKCGVNVSTISRWQRDSAFSAAIALECERAMESARSQMSATALEAMTASIETVRALRAIVQNPKSKPAEIIKAGELMLKTAERWHQVCGVERKLLDEALGKKKQSCAPLQLTTNVSKEATS